MSPASLIPEIWALIARFALAADGSTVNAWIRLSLVNQTFRSALAGEHTSPRLSCRDTSAHCAHSVPDQNLQSLYAGASVLG